MQQYKPRIREHTTSFWPCPFGEEDPGDKAEGHTHTCTHMYMHTCIYTHVYTYIHTHTMAHMHIHTCTHTHMHIYTCIHTPTHSTPTHPHTHTTHTQRNGRCYVSSKLSTETLSSNTLGSAVMISTASMR